MGKVFQVLNRAAGTHRPTPSAPRILENGSAPPPDAPEEPNEEVPFIEVGPRKSVQASPGVLATTTQAKKDQRGAANDPHTAPIRTVLAQAEPVSSVLQSPHVVPQPIAFPQPAEPTGERYHQLLDRLTLPRADTPARLLLFSPAAEAADELTVTVLLNLAVTAARGYGRSVVVVDADFRQPRIARTLGLKEHPGLGEILAGECALEPSLQLHEQATLFALTAGTGERSGGVRCVVETVRSVLRQLRQRFDLVLVRGPIWDGGSDAGHLAEVCDGVYPVLPEAEATTPRVDEVLQTIPHRGTKPTGCILATE
jgi:Mrp family chromosome partitioning ATPase